MQRVIAPCSALLLIASINFARSTVAFSCFSAFSRSLRMRSSSSFLLFSSCAIERFMDAGRSSVIVISPTFWNTSIVAIVFISFLFCSFIISCKGLFVNPYFLIFCNVAHFYMVFILANLVVYGSGDSGDSLSAIDGDDLVHGGNVSGDDCTISALDNQHTCVSQAVNAVGMLSVRSFKDCFTEAHIHCDVSQAVKPFFSYMDGHLYSCSFHNSFSFWCVLFCSLYLYYSTDFVFVKCFFLFFFCDALGKHHSQKHESQNTNTQTTSAQDVSSNVIVVLAVVHGTLVCVVDVPADAVANVAKFSLDVFHGLFPLSFICLYYNMRIGICQLSDYTK